jgi:hypothetical protein
MSRRTPLQRFDRFGLSMATRERLVLLLQGDEGATFFHRVAGYGFGKFAALEQ